ncbi:MAG: squalene synthase HpnC [Ignavibacteriae bacterium]|nr:squalene synthase HpnC [Ignavibacteriota bacterium]
MINNSHNIEKAYKNAIEFTKSHYENFPVISVFVKKSLRKHVAVFYQFARQADDIVDEGEKKFDEKISQLDEYEDCLNNAFNNNFQNEFWAAVKNTVDLFNLSPKNFKDLLKAFRQDITKSRYHDFTELLNYCSNSANPVGRVILELNNIHDENLLQYSDDICTALQLTNFWQDVSIDFEKDRIYLPLNDMKEFGIREKDIEQKKYGENFKKLMKLEIDRTRKLFFEGRKLIKHLPGRLKYQIYWTVLGGEKILDKIERNDYNSLNLRPRLFKTDYIQLLIKSLFGLR